MTTTDDPSPRNNKTSVRGWIAVGALTAVPVLTLLGAVIATSLPSAQIDPPEKPITVSVEASTYSDSTSVELTVTWGESPLLRAPSWSGLVTGIPDSLDTPLITGSHVIQVDGVWRVAARTDRPFFRPLGEGDSGVDVRALNRLLGQMGYRSQESDKWTKDTLRGVRKLAASLGISPDSVTSFDPGWVVWLPHDSFTAESLAVKTGERAPEVGMPVVTGLPVPTSAAIKTERARLPKTSPEGWQFDIDGTKLPYTDNPGSPFPDLGALSSVLHGKPETIRAALERTTPLQAWTVPVRAVFTDARGQMCVFVQTELRGTKQWQPNIVEVLGGEIGRTRVTGIKTHAVNILANPAESHRDSTCT
ncbi:MAG: hypothetical protein B5766_01305 [Candidatus Lumbricidophila eiseniae]|uniref:Peptidoglycan binding-like domain-containing protein n=1 Tax=Candidatus Lumbricidiphila eiseniae TaxID=1969409 RepID=A0A2A6FUR3_9MICO|nr:MAG: hypothetical protein B5766_01305 [Candidatus Lumbricidophila eiseniae]